MQTNAKCLRVDNEQDLNAILKTEERLVGLFFASWCPYCAKFLPVFERNAGGAGLHFLAVKDDQERMMDRFGIAVVPTVLFFEKGTVSKRLDGSPGVGLNESQLADFIINCRS